MARGDIYSPNIQHKRHVIKIRVIITMLKSLSLPVVAIAMCGHQIFSIKFLRVKPAVVA